MLSNEAFFKIRPTKRSNPEARTTLDCLHQVHVQNILNNESELNHSLAELTKIDEEIGKTVDEVRQEQLRKLRNEHQRGINRSTGNSEMFDYFLDAGDILYNYYNNLQSFVHILCLRLYEFRLSELLMLELTVVKSFFYYLINTQ